MKLKTYRLNIDRREQRDLIVAIYDHVLKRDKTWHFFRDEGGMTLRCSPKFHKPLSKFLTKVRKTNFSVSHNYDPAKNEYSGIKFLGDDWIPLFNVLSVLSVKYPGNVTLKQVLERVNHAIVNQAGIHNFYKEAEIYSELALKRAEIGGAIARDSVSNQ